MPWHCNSIFQCLELKQEQGVWSRDIPCFNQVRPFNQSLQLSHFKPSHLLLLLSRVFFLTILLLTLFFIVRFTVLFFLGFVCHLIVPQSFLLVFLEDPLKMIIVFTCENILVFLKYIYDFDLTCFGLLLQSLLFQLTDLFLPFLKLGFRLLLPLFLFNFLLLNLFRSQLRIYFPPHKIKLFQILQPIQTNPTPKNKPANLPPHPKKYLKFFNKQPNQKKYNIKKQKKMDIEASVIVEIDQIIDISSAQIVQVLSMTMSLTRKYCVVGTENGFCLVDNNRKSFRRFENQKNPFKKELNTGVELGTALEERSEVAIIPSRNSKSFSRTVVYIYDYQLNTILYSNDFFLPIRQITLTDDTIIVSNNKRIIIYNYSNDLQQKTQEYYLKMYASQQPNNNIRYLEMSCEERFTNNSVKQIDGEDQRLLKQCMCGKYAISEVKPYKIVYTKIYTLNAKKMIQLSIYNSAYDKDYVFDSFNYNEPFSFTISGDGNYLAHSDKFGKYVVVYKIDEKGVLCNLEVSSTIKECLSHGFFAYDDNIWYAVLRRGDNSSGHMHFFKIPKAKSEKQVKKSYTRYFSLFERTLADYGVSNKLIGPDFYVINGAVYSPSACGAVVEVIDFAISGKHIKKTSENIIKWVEDLS